MLQSEFTARTGYQPTAEEYAEIQENYMAFSGSKDGFCKAWKQANASKVEAARRVREAAEHEWKEEEKAITIVLRFCQQNGRITWDEIPLSSLFVKCDRAVAYRTVRRLHDWHGVTQAFTSPMWERYWALFAAVAH